MIRAEEGDTVKVNYTGKLADGTVFDASPLDQPLLFILGKQEVIPGFEEGVAGMYQLEKKSFTVPPEKGYGLHDPKLVEEIDRGQLPDDLELQAGRQLEITAQDGNRLLVMVTGVSEQTVTLDGNHPLAGKELTFEVELLEVRKKPAASAPPVPKH